MITENKKLEYHEDQADNFASDLKKTKIIVHGNVGNYSAKNPISSKFTIHGSVGKSFGENAIDSEFYVLSTVGEDSFRNIKNSKVISGDSFSKDVFLNAKSSTIIVLNLKDEKLDFLPPKNNCLIYARSKGGLPGENFLSTNEDDEDIYLPLISEFSRLFKLSLSDIKSANFYKLK